MKYLDLVELTKEKPAYTKAGVKPGDFGAVMSEKAIDGKWQVVFSEFYTGKDIADIMVNEEDLKVHDDVPMDRYPKKLKQIKPSMVLCYDEPFKSMKGNIKEFLPTTYEWTKDLNWKDLIHFKWEKQNKNVSGLNENNFKYFKYDDPYVKDQLVKCSICGHIAMQDQYGNGECKNCGWKFSKDEELLEKKAGISYPMLVTPTTAREQYKKGLPFKATFDEFVNGLYFYSEMLFEYNNEVYEVFLRANKNSKSNEDCDIVFCSNGMQQEYKTRQDFESKANIGGILLKDLWGKVNNPSYMYCG